MEKIETVRALVRPFISVFMILTFVYLAIVGKIPPKEVATIVGLVIAFHFGERAAAKKQNDQPPIAPPPAPPVP